VKFMWIHGSWIGQISFVINLQRSIRNSKCQQKS